MSFFLLMLRIFFVQNGLITNSNNDKFLSWRIYRKTESTREQGDYQFSRFKIWKETWGKMKRKEIFN
ncbi:hypothetical protein CsatA_023199 [Cannabis sativa]